MKYRILSFVVLLVSSCYLFSQNKSLTVNYNYNITCQNMNLELKANDLYQLSKMVIKMPGMSSEEEESSSNANKYIRYAFFDLKNKRFISEYKTFFGSNVQIIESFDDLPKWKLGQDEKKILNFRCQSATTDYRGRKYKVFFTSELGFNAGPWKFRGLPGVILEVKSLDGDINILPKEIIVNANNEIISNPYPDKKLVTWEKYLELFERDWNKHVALFAKRGMSMEYDIGCTADIEIISPGKKN